MSSQEKEVHRRGLYYVIPSAIMDSEALEPMAKARGLRRMS